MSINLHSRSFLSLRDFTPEEIAYLLNLAAELKAAKLAGTEVKHLVDQELALIFEKDSTRTRVGFEVAACAAPKSFGQSPPSLPRRRRS